MKIEYLSTSQPGVRWFREYYRNNPHLNLEKAVSALRAAEQRLREFPYAGSVFDGNELVRECKIPATTFSLLYSVSGERVLVIDLRDQRGCRSAEALRAFIQELRSDMLP